MMARALQRKQQQQQQQQQQNRRRKLPPLPQQQQQQQQHQQPPIVLLQAHVQRLVHQLQRLVEALPAVPGIGWPSPLMLQQLFPQLRGHPEDDRHRKLARDFVESIMGRDPEPIEGSDGMSVLRNVMKLETGVTAKFVVIRRVTRKFWQACIDAADTPEERIRVAAIGTAGIGKTACTPLLIKMLLERGTKVVYHIRTCERGGRIYEFVPGPREGDPVVANVYPETTRKTDIPSLNDPSAYYVVDPGKSQDDCTPSCLFQPKVILVTSPDKKHWGDSSFFKRRDDVSGCRKFYPVWELEELLHARPIWRPDMTDEHVKDRYAQVGGVPSHVFAGDRHFAFLIHLQAASLHQLFPPQLQQLAQPRTLAFFDESRPESALIGFRVADDDDGDFCKHRIEVLATRAVAKAFKEVLKQKWPSSAAATAEEKADRPPPPESRRSPRLASKVRGRGAS
jgi:hypothetical protein